LKIHSDISSYLIFEFSIVALPTANGPFTAFHLIFGTVPLEIRLSPANWQCHPSLDRLHFLSDIGKTGYT